MNQKSSSRPRGTVLFAAVALAILAGIIWSFCVGKYPISLTEIRLLLAGEEVKDMTRKVFFTLRVPRTIMAMLTGAGLGIAGSVYQNYVVGEEYYLENTCQCCQCIFQFSFFDFEKI